MQYKMKHRKLLIISHPKLLLLFILFLLITVEAFAQNQTKQQRDVKPFVPIVMAMGGGYVGHSEGLPALWFNPAGLSNNHNERIKEHKGKEITAFAMSVKTQPWPNDLLKLYQGLAKLSSDDYSEVGTISNILKNSDAAFVPSVYGGLVKDIVIRGCDYLGTFGVALAHTVDTGLTGSGSFISTNMTIISQTEMMFGYSYAYSFLRNKLTIRAGVSGRSFYRVYTEMNSGQIIQVFSQQNFISEMNKQTSLHGVGVAADAGVQFEFWGFFLGSAIKNIYTPLFYRQESISNVVSGTLGDAVTDINYIIPYTLDSGVGYSFSIRNRAFTEVIRILLYGQFADTTFNIKTEGKTESIEKHLNFGTNIIFFPPLFGIQGGLHQGYPTVGLNFYLKPFYISAVYFMEEKGYLIGDRPTPGLGTEISFKW